MKNFVDLKDYLIKEIKPQKNYQFFILKELLTSEGSIPYKELAKKYDKQYKNSTKKTSEQILKENPTKVLDKHGFTKSDENIISLNFETKPEYYKNSILWILDSYLDHWDEFETIKNIRFKETIFKTEEEINNFCETLNIPEDLVKKIISSINRGEKQIILDGPPGTGKTYLIRKIIEFLSEKDSLSNLVQFHPSYGYEEFIEGLRPYSSDDGLKFKVVPGKLLEQIQDDKNNSLPVIKEVTEVQLEGNKNVEFNRKKLIESFMPVVPENITDDAFNKLLNKQFSKYELTIDDFKEVFELQKSYSSTATIEMQRREEIVRHELPNKIQNWLNDSGLKNYKVEGKGNQGRYSKTPWVRIFREEYSPRPSEGYYIVYLFDTIGERAYLSLNRGSFIPGTSEHIPVEEARKSVKEIREIIKPYTDLIEEKLSEDKTSNLVWDIDLVAEEGTTPSAYEKTHIFGFEINKNQEISFNFDLIDALELLEVVYKHLETTKEINIESLSLPREAALIYDAMKSLGGNGTIAEILEEVKKVQPNKKIPAIQRALQQYTPVKHNGDPMKSYSGNHLFNHVDEGKYELAHQNYVNTQNLEILEMPSNTHFTVEQFGKYNYFLIDEINRGNLPKIFGEMLNAFEYRDENISLQYSEESLSVPSNLIFLGTMNSTDKSVGRLDSALRRRFDFIHVEPNYDVLENFYRNKENKVPNLVDGLQDLNDTLEEDLGKHCLIGHTFFMKKNDEPFTYDDLEKIWRRKIYPLLEEYFVDDLKMLDRYGTYKNFWEEINQNEQNQPSKGKRYTEELLSEHLTEISIEHKNLYLEIEKWGEKIDKLEPFQGWNNKEGFRSGGRTWQYWTNKKNTGRYDLFRLTGNGFIVIPLMYLKTRPPFSNFEFYTQFQNKLKNFIEKFDINVKDNFYSRSKPSLEIQELIDTKSLNDFLSIWEWVIEEIEKINNLES